MMEDCKTLLARDSKRNSNFVSEGVDDHLQTLPLLSSSLQAEREHDRPDTRISLLHLKERAESQSPPLTAAAQAFLAQYVCPAVLEVFSEWQGILIESPALGEAVWIVRDPQNGRRLAQETGRPSILLDEILAQEGHTTDEIQEALSSQRNAVGGKEAKNLMHKINGMGHDVTAELTPRQEEAIAALLTCANVQEAAKKIQIGRTTLYRWLKDETFLTAYHAARRQAMTWIPGRLQRLAGKAIHTLEHILDDPEAPAPARVSAARAVLEFTLPSKEIHPEDNSLERVKAGLKPTELSLVQITTKERRHEDDAEDLVERSAGDAATQ
jgi:hypothetical protein